MLKAIKQFFDDNIAPPTAENIEHRLQLATAALLIEMMLQDGHAHDAQLQVVETALRDKFALSDDETRELFRLAREEARQAADFYQFTSLINRHFSQPQKIRVVEYLWNIAYANGRLDPHEEHLVRRIADLLYVSHKDLIQTKHKAQQALT
jgi:uncharacterized tellurite resistance protein B-like protein